MKPDAAISRFNQQLSIVKTIRERFRSSLFDIRQLAQADLFDSELEAAKELAKNKFIRAAGAVAGVVLERHLKEVCGNHDVTIRRKNPQISDLNESLKGADVVDIPQWRFIQHLGDLRNLCAHDKKPEPYLPFLPPRRDLLGVRRHAVSLQHVEPEIAPAMRPPVVCVVLPIPCVEVSGLEAEGTLTEVVNLLTHERASWCS